MTQAHKRIADRTAARIFATCHHRPASNRKLTLKMPTLRMRITLHRRKLRIRTSGLCAGKEVQTLSIVALRGNGIARRN